MQEMSNENSQCKCQDMDRPMMHGMNYPMDYDFKKNWNNQYDHKWNDHYGHNFPNTYGPFMPYNYGMNYNWPWLLLALKSINTRDLLRYIDELDNRCY